MSFDMAFAVVLILLIFTMLVGYYNTSSKAASDTSEVAALSAMADYAAGGLRALYNSLSGSPGSKADYVLEMKNDTMYGNSERAHIVDYTANIGSTLEFSSESDDGADFTVSRVLGFAFNCGLTGLSPGDKVVLKGCEASSGSLSCTCSRST